MALPQRSELRLSPQKPPCLSETTLHGLQHHLNVYSVKHHPSFKHNPPPRSLGQSCPDSGFPGAHPSCVTRSIIFHKTSLFREVSSADHGRSPLFRNSASPCGQSAERPALIPGGWQSFQVQPSQCLVTCWREIFTEGHSNA